MIRAILFDLDGTLVDTERLQWQAYRETLLRYGVDVSLEEYARRFIAEGGGPEWACRTHRLPIDPETLRAKKAVVYRRLVPDAVRACAGAADALARLADAYTLAVVTNSARGETEAILDRVGMRGAFATLVTREDYAAAKPAPDGYLEAARRLAQPARACVVVEDTARGTAAGVAAGMAVVAVPNPLTADNDFAGAAVMIASLGDLTPALLRSLGSAR